MNKKTYTDQEFIDAIKNNKSIAAVLTQLGLKCTGGNYSQFYFNVEKYKIDTSHFTGQGHLKDKSQNWSKKRPLSEICVENNNNYTSSSLRKRLIKEGVLINECFICGLKKWLDKEITLHLDHINGCNTDNRIDNLRLLCPNCHSQTDTYCGRNIKRNNEKKGIFPKSSKESQNNNFKKNCIDCGEKVYRNAIRCKKCNKNFFKKPSNRKTKINWPSIEELETQLKLVSFTTLGKELGISDNAIRKHIKKHK